MWRSYLDRWRKFARLVCGSKMTREMRYRSDFVPTSIRVPCAARSRWAASRRPTSDARARRCLSAARLTGYSKVSISAHGCASGGTSTAEAHGWCRCESIVFQDERVGSACFMKYRVKRPRQNGEPGSTQARLSHLPARSNERPPAPHTRHSLLSYLTQRSAPEAAAARLPPAHHERARLSPRPTPAPQPG